MLRIYDEADFKSQMRMKRAKTLAVFVAGAACGLWFAQSGQGVATAAQLREAPVAFSAWCHDPRAASTKLRLDCDLAPTPP